MGWSQLTGADSLIQCMAKQNFTTLALSISADDASVFLARIRGMYQQIPSIEAYKKMEQHPDDDILVAMKHYNPLIKGQDAGEEMVFKSGSSIVSLSAQKGRGRTADRVILDEMAFYTLRNSKIEIEEVLKGIEPTLDRGNGQLIGITTANGVGRFYKMFLDAIRKVSSYKAFFVSCYDDPDFTEAKRNQIVADHGEEHANQEYPRTWKEAFIASGSPRFDMKCIDWYSERTLKPIAKGEIRTEILKDVLGYEYMNEWIDLDGECLFYKMYEKDALYMVVADVAEGLDSGDFSIAKVFKIVTGELVAEWHGHLEPADFGDILVLFGLHYNNALIAPEANNHGISTIQRIRDRQYRNIFVGTHTSERSDDKYKQPGRRYGWLTTETSKKAIIDNLANMILHKEVPWFTEEDVQELQYYVRKNGKTNAQDGHYDDRVMCLAIFYYLKRFVDIPKFVACKDCKNFNPRNKVCTMNYMLRDEEKTCIFAQEIDYDDIDLDDE